MPAALQVLDPSVISVLGVTLLIGNGVTDVSNLPIPCYPFKIAYVVGSPLSGLGPFDIEIFIGSQKYYSNIGMPVTTIDVPANPIQVGGFFVTVDGVSSFSGLTPPTGDVSLSILPALPDPDLPYMTVHVVNNSGAPDLYYVEIGCELVGKAFDSAPIMYPGLGPSATISSGNV